MNSVVIRRIAAVVAVVFSGMSLIEGTQVLLGLAQPDYVVLKPLLIYNVLMAIPGIIAGVALWPGRRWAFRLAAVITAAHVVVLLVIGTMYLSGGSVALHSVQAMLARSVAWSLIAWIAGRNVSHRASVEK